MIALDKRKLCIQRRSSLSNSKRFEKEKAITNCVLPFLKGKIGTYIPIRNEVDVYANQRIIAGNAQFTGIAAGRGVGFTT